MRIEELEYIFPEEQISEKDFDIEKWRRENPMDYLKAIYLINKSSNRNEVFRCIYSITRLHIPDTLYKYYSLTNDISLNEQKIETLRQEKIFMSDAKYLNDPFDSKAYFYRPDDLKNQVVSHEFNGKVIEDFSIFAKVSALTSNDTNSMPMWAHYANNHMGYCVSYDMKNNLKLSSCTFPVQYTDQRIDITSLMVDQVQKMLHEIETQSSAGKKEIIMDDLSLIFLISLFCNIKHLSWRYENEFRCTTGATEKGMPYVPAMPKEIFIGKNCLSTYADRLTKVAEELNIPVYKMIFDELGSEFNLLCEKV